MSESFPVPEIPRVIIEVPTPPSMTLELAGSQTFLDGSFFYNFYPGRWPQGQKLKNEVTEEVLQAARLLARLDEVDELMKTNRIKMPTQDQRLFVWLKNKGQCNYCHKNVHPDFGGLNPDHYKPFSRGGHTVTANLVCACSKCNLAKNQDEGEDFERLMRHEKGKYYRDVLYNERYRGIRPSDEDAIAISRIMYVPSS